MSCAGQLVLALAIVTLAACASSAPPLPSDRSPSLPSLPSAAAAAASPLSAGEYDVVWTAPGAEPGMNAKQQPTYYSGLPIGNGDLVAYVWPNVSSGEVSMYVSKADAMASDTALFKLAKATLRISPDPFEGCRGKR